jgi:hypothetical protein
MAASEIVKQSHDAGSIVLSDGTSGTPLSCTVRFDSADFSASGLSAAQREAVVYQSRGVLRSVRNGALQFPTLTFSMMVTDLTDSDAGTVLDFLHKTGSFSARVSTNTTQTERFFCTIVYTIEGSTYGDAADAVMTFTLCDVSEYTIAEGEPNTISLTFTCYGTATRSGS